MGDMVRLFCAHKPLEEKDASLVLHLRRVRESNRILMATRENLPSFYKIVPGDQFTNKLEIPTEFLQHFHGNVPHQCHLQTAARTCLVHVEVINNKFYFQKGWNEFLQENRLKYGQVIIFHYAGNSHFHVDIFGKDTCRELFVMSETEVSHEMSEESPVSSSLPQRKYKTSSIGKAKRKNKEARRSKSEMKKKDRGGTSSTQRFKEKDFWGARMRAEAFILENPSAFLVSMKPSYIKFKFVWLPAEFAMLVKPFIENSGDVFLRVSNRRARTWMAQLTCSNIATKRCKLHGVCWAEFMRDNKLEEGDLCAFTVIKDIRVLIEVVIFDTKEAETHSLSPDYSDNEYHENDEEGDDETGDEEETEDEEEEEEDDKSEDEEDTEDEEVEEDDNSSETLNYVPPGSRTESSRLHNRMRNWTNSIAKSQSNIKNAGGLSRDKKISNSIALEKANAFKSESASPCLVVSLSSTYAGGSYMSFPRSFAEKYLSKRRPKHIILWVKRSTSFWIKINYTEKTTRLQAGWSGFVRVNNLKVGNVCAFVLTNPEKFEFDVEIFRSTDAICTSSKGKGKQLRTDSTLKKQKSR